MSHDLLIPDARIEQATRSLPGDVRLAGNAEEQMLQLAQEFEAMLILQMLRQMQQSVLSEEEGQSGFGSGPLGDTMHQEVARQMAQTGGFGLAETLADALGRQTGLAAAPVDPTFAPGGTPTHALKPAAGAERRAPADPATPPALPSLAVPMPLESSLSSSFGWRTDPINGQRRFHGGVDIRAPEGQEVPAAKAGRIVVAGDQGGYGTTVVIEHDDGVRTRYAHLSSVAVAEGDVVKAGQAIGAVGQTGRATGPHLHFEVLQDGQRRDPQLTARRFAEALKKVEDMPISPSVGRMSARESLWSSE